MTIPEIEELQEVKEAAAVLRLLEKHGISEPAIAAGWTRTLLTGGQTNDIDVSYVGKVHFEDAQKILQQVLDELDPSTKDIWDINGIWNAQMAYGIKHTVDNFLLYYLNSIDSVYLATDGKLHDPTGFGFADAQTRTLRVNEYDLLDRTPGAPDDVNVCLENCRRLAKFGWTPTDKSVERIKGGVVSWHKLTDTEKTFFVNKLRKKYAKHERRRAQMIYENYGWGFIFDL